MHELNAIDKKKRINIRERLEVMGTTETTGTGTPCQIGECITLHDAVFFKYLFFVI